MLLNALTAFQLLQQLEEDELHVEKQLAMQLGGAILLGALESRRLRAARRQQSRLYLCRPQLLPNPRIDTPWQILYSSTSDRAFITTMGFDTITFNKLLDAGFRVAWNSITIPRCDVSITGNPRLGRRSLDAAGALGLVLHYLNSTMREISLQQIFALIPTSVTRYIIFGLHILLKVLQKLPEARINWPRTVDDFEELNSLIVARHSRLAGAFASIDGLNLPVETAEDEELENATYNGWLCDHFISSVLVFSPEGKSSFNFLL
ncbi:hypothetical protein GGX14DRAFT_406285 [Mycena pura]|uniref:Uncharacterized protein n=1 Tax=Mycena pura TaxID=153505 RepID=A0AAD6UQ94_9AGAR|nr:hypothetical protein GGX14DRAFT_406285 [Mycena pura]